MRWEMTSEMTSYLRERRDWRMMSDEKGKRQMELLDDKICYQICDMKETR